ncbi:MAG TPA: L-asparaginase 1 [Clostridiales bacterium]|nr:L-asparaginase 1 [Clostridiales bacterium]
MKKILMIATGGTIASRIGPDGLSPEMNAEEILSFVPEVRSVCEIDAVRIMNIDSTNVTPCAWLEMAKTVRENYGKYDGFVICHGTDTMAYTAAVLSYLIQDSPKPIILTGSQKPIDIGITDAKTNLSDSFLYCASDFSRGVSIVFDGKVISGVRAKKVRSKSFNAFESINYPYLAVISDGRIIQYGAKKRKRAVKFYDKLEENVGLLKLIPGLKPEIMEEYFKLHKAVIVESFGVGGIPDAEEFSYYDVIEKWRKKGRIAVMCTQVVNEGSDMSVYKVGKSLKEKYGFLESYDMTPEAVVAKLMWLLPLAKTKRQVEKLFYKNVSDDLLYD